MNFKADQVGRNMLYFVVNSQPSNVVVVDVFPQAQATAASSYPVTGQIPVNVLGNTVNPSRSLSQTSDGLTTTTTSNGLTTTTSNGQAVNAGTTGDRPGNAAGHTGAPGQN
jgi:hypothetical protein